MGRGNLSTLNPGESWGRGHLPAAESIAEAVSTARVQHRCSGKRLLGLQSTSSLGTMAGPDLAQSAPPLAGHGAISK